MAAGQKKVLASESTAIDHEFGNQYCECELKEYRPENLYYIHLFGMIAVSFGVFQILMALFWFNQHLINILDLKNALIKL